MGAPPGTLQVNPAEGFGPHIAGPFLGQYGEGSVFVTATVDRLTHRFVAALKKSGKLPNDYVPVQYGPPEMRETLENLLNALTALGVDKPSVLLMRSAVGHEEPQRFIMVASSVLGNGLVTSWLHRLELEDYAGANSALVPH